MENTKEFVPVFKVFKKGTTNGYITIVKPKSEAYDVAKKMEFYRSLGYDVKSIN